MAETISAAEAKSRFSELVGRAAFGRERFLICRRGRPVGAIVSPEDLRKLEQQQPSKPGGLLAIVGLFDGIEGFDTIMEEVVAGRASAEDR